MMVSIGPFVVGDVPDPERYTFVVAGAAVDLTGWTGAFFLTRPDGTVVRGVIDDTGLDTGVVAYDWGPDDLTIPGVYRAVFRVWEADEDDADLKYTSDRIVFYVRPAPAAAVISDSYGAY